MSEYRVGFVNPAHEIGPKGDGTAGIARALRKSLDPWGFGDDGCKFSDLMPAFEVIGVSKVQDRFDFSMSTASDPKDEEIARLMQATKTQQDIIDVQRESLAELGEKGPFHIEEAELAK